MCLGLTTQRHYQIHDEENHDEHERSLRMSLNKVMLIGRLTRDPEMRYTPAGQPVTSFSMATNRYTGGGDSGERKEFTDYHDCVAWNIGRRNLAEIIAQHLKRGAQVYVEGRLQTRSWEDQSGQKRRKTEVVVSDIQFLDSAPRQQEQQASAGDGYAQQPAAAAAGGYAPPATSAGPGFDRDVDPDDIPF